MSQIELESRALMMRRLLIFALISLGCFILGALLASLFLRTINTPHVRIATVVQDVVMFIVPAIATAVVCSRYPARFLAIDRLPRIGMTLSAVFTLFISAPLQDAIIKWNESLQLPDSFAALKGWMKAAETSATETVKLLMGGSTIGDLIISLMIVGVFAGLGEELFFRGTLQRILSRNKFATHAAVWVTAFIFSAFHFQFYGFFPRLLLGAYFGYLAWWSRSLWLPVLVHIVNNSIVVVNDWSIRRAGLDESADYFGNFSTGMVIASAIATIAGIAMLSRWGEVNQTSCDKTQNCDRDTSL